MSDQALRNIFNSPALARLVFGDAAQLSQGGNTTEEQTVNNDDDQDGLSPQDAGHLKAALQIHLNDPSSAMARAALVGTLKEALAKLGEGDADGAGGDGRSEPREEPAMVSMSHSDVDESQLDPEVMARLSGGRWKPPSGAVNLSRDDGSRERLHAHLGKLRSAGFDVPDSDDWEEAHVHFVRAASKKYGFKFATDDPPTGVGQENKTHRRSQLPHAAAKFSGGRASDAAKARGKARDVHLSMQDGAEDLDPEVMARMAGPGWEAHVPKGSASLSLTDPGDGDDSRQRFLAHLDALRERGQDTPDDLEAAFDRFVQA